MQAERSEEETRADEQPSAGGDELRGDGAKLDDGEGVTAHASEMGESRQWDENATRDREPSNVEEPRREQRARPDEPRIEPGVRLEGARIGGSAAFSPAGRSGRCR